MILVVGASGQVGRALLKELAGREVVGTGHTRADGLTRLDLADAAAVKRLILDLKPSGILVPGGVTAVDWCEDHEGEARRICVDGTRAICEAAAAVQAHVVHFSTDYVFSGAAGPYDEAAIPDPISAYGRIKLDAERAADRGAVIRTSMVYSGDPTSKNFRNFVVGALQSGNPVRAFTDQSGSPTYAPALASAAVEILDNGLDGLWHVAGPEVLTRLEFARRVARAAGLEESLIVPVTSDEFPLPAARPGLRGGLAVRRARNHLQSPLISLDEALDLMRKGL